MKKWLVFLTVGICLASPIKAGVPVVDPAQLLLMADQWTTMKDQWDTLKDQWDTMKNQLEADVGNTNFSGFLENSLEEMHSFKPTTIDDIQLLASNGGGVDEIKQLTEKLKQDQNAITADQVFRAGKDDSSRKHFNDELDDIYGAMAVAQHAYNQSGARKSTLDQLRASIKETQAPKDREQLQLRISAENALLLNDLYQMISFDLLVRQKEKARRFNKSYKVKKAKPRIRSDY